MSPTSYQAAPPRRIILSAGLGRVKRATPFLRVARVTIVASFQQALLRLRPLERDRPTVLHWDQRGAPHRLEQHNLGNLSRWIVKTSCHGAFQFQLAPSLFEFVLENLVFDCYSPGCIEIRIHSFETN